MIEKKLLYFILLMTLFGYESNAQKYNAGIVYNDTILKGMVSGQNGDCFNTIEVSDSLINYITGLNLSIQIINIKNTDSINVYNAISLASYGVLKVGDTLPISSKRTKYNFTFSGYNIFDFALLASGTPTIANESYYCNLKSSSYRLIYYDCGPFSEFSISPDSSYVKNCKIGNLTTGIRSNYSKPLITITPNPVSNFICVKLNSNDYLYQVNIYDLRGIPIIEHRCLYSNEANIDLTDIPIGIYFVEAKISEKRFVFKFLKTN